MEVDALFIPDNYDAVAQIAPYLAFYGFKTSRFLAPMDGTLRFSTELAEEHVDGAVFVDGFFAKSIRAETKDFVESFKRVYGYEPGLWRLNHMTPRCCFFSLCPLPFDDYQDRNAVRDRLLTAGIYHGATGDIYFDAMDGEALKELFLLTVEEGR